MPWNWTRLRSGRMRLASPPAWAGVAWLGAAVTAGAGGCARRTAGAEREIAKKKKSATIDFIYLLSDT
jgi:hypothetical protein